MTDLFEFDFSPHATGGIEEDILIVAEAPEDADLYNRLAGPTLRRHVRFVTPRDMHQPEDGWFNAVDAVRKWRAKATASGTSPDRYYCLLDGEESVRWGNGFEILHARDLLFEINDPKAVGFLFLNCYERENLHLLHGSALDFTKQVIGQHIPLAGSAEEGPKVYTPETVWMLVGRALLLSGLKAAIKRSRLEETEDVKHLGALNNLLIPIGLQLRDVLGFRSGKYQQSYEKRMIKNGKEIKYGSNKAHDDARFNTYWRAYRRALMQRVREKLATDPYDREILRLIAGKEFNDWIAREKNRHAVARNDRSLLNREFGLIFQTALIKVLTSRVQKNLGAGA